MSEIPVYQPFLEDQDLDLSERLQGKWISQKGNEVSKFEERVNNHLNVDKGLATDSGTSALEVALETLDVDGGEVLVPGLTFGASILPVVNLGAKPVPVDINNDHEFDLNDLKEKISDSTEAIILVHLFGEPCNIEEVIKIAEKHEISVIEDSAQGFCSKKDGKNLGTIADIGIYSFSWNKTITTGKGGFITSRNQEMMSKISSIVNNGVKNNRKFSRSGHNYRMESIRAALGNKQFQRFDAIKKKKKSIFERYLAELNCLNTLDMPNIGNGVMPWVFYIKHEKRASIVRNLNDAGISSRKFYPSTDNLGIVNSKYNLRKSRQLSSKGLMLPSYPGLDLEDVDRISSIIFNTLNG